MKLRTVALDNLRRRKSRAAFLVAGLLVGIGTVVTLLTLSAALTVEAQNNLETFGANILVAPRTDKGQDLVLATADQQAGVQYLQRSRRPDPVNSGRVGGALP